MVKKTIFVFVLCVMIMTSQMAFCTEDTTISALGLSESEKASYKETGFDFDDYEAYLSANGISVVEGNITIETTEQFLAVLEYYWKYLSLHVCDPAADEDPYRDEITLQMAAEYIVALNFPFIPASVLQDLVNEDLITSPFTFFEEQWNAATIIGVRLLTYAKTNNTNEFITKLPVIYNADIRQCVQHLEQELHAFIINPLKVSKSISSSLTYNNVFVEFICFWIGRDFDDMSKSLYPFKLSELDPSAKCVFSIIYSEIYFPMMSSGVTPGDFTKRYYDFIAKKDSSLLAKKYVKQYLDVVPPKKIE
jgi:hypothetical protein